MSAIVRSEINFDVKRSEIQNCINEMFDRFRQQEEQIDADTHRDSRNVLLVGPSKSGKTTLIRVLNEPRYISEELSLRSSPDVQTFCERNMRPTDVPMIVNIIELPAKMISTASDVSMINEECTRLGIHDFHLIGLCVSFDAGIDGFAIQSFEHFINYFGHEQIKRNLCLIITRCESKNDNQRTKLHNEVMHDIQFRKVSQHLGRGIYFSGALNRDSWNGANESLYSQFQTVYEYRRSLFELIAENIPPFHIPPPSSAPRYCFSTKRQNGTIFKAIIDLFRNVQMDSMETVPVRSSKRKITTEQPLSSPKYQRNTPLEQTHVATPLSSDRTSPRSIHWFSWLREYVFSCLHLS